ncbi:hypothetical protein D3C71_531570 [compost metagenome]
MPRKNSGPVAVPFNDGKSTPTDAARRKAVDKVLDQLVGLGLNKRDARFNLENTMVKVLSKDGSGIVRVDLGRTDPADVLMKMFDAVWKAGVDAGTAAERDRSAASLLQAFPALKDAMREIADERIEANNSTRYGDDR